MVNKVLILIAKEVAVTDRRKVRRENIVRNSRTATGR